MRIHFDDQLEKLNQDLIRMGSLIEAAIVSAATALTEHNTKLAEETIDNDTEINDMERSIERHCIKMLLQQHPVAGDLRQISTALKMITDMERIGDHAADISEVVLMISDTIYIKKLEHIPQMAEHAVKMVSDAIDAYVKRDQVLAGDVIRHDDLVDELFVAVRDDLVDLIRQNPENAPGAMDLLMIAKYFERIGDHAVNIAEWVICAITGLHKDKRLF